MTARLQSRHRKRTWYLLAFGVTLALGLASRRFPHLLPVVLGKYPGDVLWALMVFFGMGVIFIKVTTLQLGCRALAFSFGIEALKLCKLPWLVSLRHTTPGHLVFGHLFSWQNMAAYTLGVLLGLLVEALVMPGSRTVEGTGAA